MKKIHILLVLFILTAYLAAEDWKVESNIALSMNQNSYSNNWSGGEKGSLSWISGFDFLAEKQLNPKMLYKNTLKLEFGQTHTQYIDEETNDRKWAKPDKSTDKIDFESIMFFTLGVFVDPYVSGRIESQFLDESMVDETKMFNPNLITESIGFSKFFIKEETKELSTRLGASFKQHLNSHEDFDNTSDGGIEFVADYKTPLAKEIFNFSSKLNVYKAFFYSESDEVEGTDFEDAWKAPRVNWENILSASITKLINMNFNFTLIYNETHVDALGEILDEMQYKQTLSLGLSYKLK